MLLSLSVKNFILLEELYIEFNNGLTVITGETGAGKSILLDALLFCLGEKYSSNIITNNAEACSVTASFEIQNKELLEKLDIEYGNELIIKRNLNINGKGKFFVNDEQVTQKTISQLAKLLLEVHAQNNLGLLTDPKTHLDILDAFADIDILKANLAKNVKIWQELKNELALINQEQLKIVEEIEFLKHATEEIQLANIGLHEEKTLIDTKQRLQRKGKEIKIIEDILFSLDIDQIDQGFGKALRVINRLPPGESEEFNQISTLIEDAYNNVEQAKIFLKNKLKIIKSSDENIEVIDERLYFIRSIARKYQFNLDDVESFLITMKEKLNFLETRINSTSTLTNELKKVQHEYTVLADDITIKRKKAASKLEMGIQLELFELKMEKSVFKIVATRRNVEDLPNINGNEIIKFKASTNPGIPLAPIDEIASGGELSRMMLAIKVVLFNKGPKGTIIFDEIDTGIGGAVADSVGEKLKYLGKATQIIAITHQPQVASKANSHILVTKRQLAKQTILEVKTLNNEERQQELARMLSGKSITESSLNAARELLE